MRMRLASVCAFVCVIATMTGIARANHVDEIQRQVMNNARHLEDVIVAYQHRFSIDDDPAVVLSEYVALLHRHYSDFDRSELSTPMVVRKSW